MVLGGTQGDQGQTKGQNEIYGRRGVGMNKVWRLGTMEMIRKPPPSGGGGGGAAETEQTSALQVTLVTCGAHKKNPKI